MGYQKSDAERENAAWFVKDETRASLRRIVVRKGKVRGLGKLAIDFLYPITAIAGSNGSGKSTVLALAACAFHNSKDGWKLPDRKSNYYTFSDFFVQADGEVSVEGIEIAYQIHYDDWTDEPPSLGYQTRTKAKGGRWNDYAERVERSVAFFGIERVVPSAEKSVIRGHRYNFSQADKSGLEEAICEYVSKVLSTPYDMFEFRSHGKYRLPWVKRSKGASYSGFNMGAGEKALFELFAALLSAPKGTLFLIDEIELGLHESAQKGLFRALTEICNKRKIQVICTTHSSCVLAALPPEGRVFLDNTQGETSVIPGISPAYASGRLAGENSRELTIYVEDNNACVLVRSCLPKRLNSRVNICPIGSHAAVVSAMAVRYKDSSLGAALAILDGDQRVVSASHLRRFKGIVEDAGQSASWLTGRLAFLPGDGAPELVLLGRIRELDDGVLSSYFKCDAYEVRDAIDQALLMNDHSQLYEFSRLMHQTEDHIWRDCCQLLAREDSALFDEIVAAIEDALVA